VLDELYLAFFVSLFAGLIGSMVGVGGGIINGPYLSFLNYFPSQISATSLIAVLSTSISSSIQYLRRGLIQTKIGLTLAIFSIPGTIVGVHISNNFSLEQFRYLFGVILLSTAIYLLVRPKLYKKSHSKFDSNANSEHFHIRNIRIVLLVTLSFIAGIISSSFGVGGGIIFVPCLIMLMNFTVKSSTATSQFALIFTSISGLIIFVMQGRPDYQMGLVLSLGGIIGGALGSQLSLRMNSSFILKMFSGLLVIVSLKLIYDGMILQE
jgi:uncharacterized membrane protein YfcA